MTDMHMPALLEYTISFNFHTNPATFHFAGEETEVEKSVRLHGW